MGHNKCLSLVTGNYLGNKSNVNNEKEAKEGMFRETG